MTKFTPEVTPTHIASAPQTPQVLPAYEPPVLTPLGAWQTLTLQMSTPIGAKAWFNSDDQPYS